MGGGLGKVGGGGGGRWTGRDQVVEEELVGRIAQERKHNASYGT